MLRKLGFIFLMAACIDTPQPISAQVLAEQKEVVAHESYEGIYGGVMDVEMGKGKKYEERPATFVMRHDTLFCDFPKMGKMPGKITIELPIKVLEDGSISAQMESEAGTMRMPMGMKFKLKLASFEKGKVEHLSLQFVMTVYGQFLGTKYPTTISFNCKVGHTPAD